MLNHGRFDVRRLSRRAMLLTMVSLAAEATGLPVRAARWPDAMVADADLQSVHFVDAELGWAVGDHGAIWHTHDGGLQWHAQTAPVDAFWQTVHFIDARTGWVAGGYRLPYTSVSRGRMLHTVDGGTTWREIPASGWPEIRACRFLDADKGFVACGPSSLFPRGLLKSQDGGRAWSSQSAASVGGWIDASWDDWGRGTAVTSTGEVAVVQGAEVHAARLGEQVPAPVRAIARDRDTVLAVGEVGSVWRSANGGKTWQDLSITMPAGVGELFDFHAVALRGKQVWIVGNPGTVVFHSADMGQTWSVNSTGQSLPLADVMFVDDQRGWAVGAAGVVVSTTDGGATWQVQRSANIRAAALAVVSSPDRIDWELLAHLSAGDGYRCRVLVVDSPADDARRQLAYASREIGVGVAGCYSEFALPDPRLKYSAQQLLEIWRQQKPTAGLPPAGGERLVARLVRDLRVWQPDILITENQQFDGAANLMVAVVKTSVGAAGSPEVLSKQITAAELKPWTVRHVWQRVVAPERAASAGDTRIATSSIALSLGQSVGDLAARARAMVQPQYTTSPLVIPYQRVMKATSIANPSTFFAGVSARNDSPARRAAMSPVVANVAQIQQTAQQRRLVDSLLNQMADGSQPGYQWLGQLDDLVRGMDQREAGEVLHRLATRAQATGQLGAAAEVRDAFLARFPNHVLRHAVLTEALQTRVSAELQLWRGRTEPPQAVRPAAAISPGGTGLPPGGGPSWQRLLAAADPVWLAEPSIRVMLAAASRSLGDTRRAEQELRRLQLVDEPWRTVANHELLLQGPNLRNGWTCRQGPRPKLDGELLDPIWKRADWKTFSALPNSNAVPATEVSVCYDAEFFYIAARCQSLDIYSAAPQGAVRTRDADLSAQDRVELLLDTDRDRATQWRLTVDHRGWTGESCGGDPAWNPTWYVAAGKKGNRWTVEAAVRRDELAAQLKSRDTWCIAARRIMPGAGGQAWPQSDTLTPQPSEFGFLVFE